MDNQFTEKMQAWLSTPKESRNLEEGATMVLQLTRNKILHANMMRNLPKFAEKIEYEMYKHLKLRLGETTHLDVEALQHRVDEMVKETKIDKSGKTVQKEAQKGKRADHDSLPDEIKKCYTDNLDILQKMRHLHLKLAEIPVDGDACHDSDRYPFLKELVDLDKKRVENWKRYDAYKQEAEA